LTEESAGPTIELRRATDLDGGAVADVYLTAFKATYDFPLAHTDDEVRGWIAGHLVPAIETWVADEAGRVVGMMALESNSLDQLYVDPDRQGRGIGSRLVQLAKARRPDGLELYTFQVNERARRFYERNGFVVAALGDGSGNEEGQPDVLYRWRPEP
jgi:ribosomal protein S18 acetylase RimI-like enzyme